MRTKSGLPKHCSWATDRHGKRRVRFRKGGFSTYLAGTPWSPDFMRAYAAALDGVRAVAASIGAERTRPGTINALVVAYYRSPDFRALKASTQASRRGIIERFRNEHGHKPVARIERAHIKAILGAKAATPEAANNLLKVLRVMLAFAVDAGMITRNPATGVKKYRSRSQGFHTWTDDEIARFEQHHPGDSKARLALVLLLWTAQRRSDVVRMGWQHVRDGLIAVRQEKTGKPLLIPIAPELASALASSPRTNLTFLVTEYGAPFTPAGFGNWFRTRCNEAGLSHCSAHGLRKAAATRLANVGCSTDQIKAITGHRSLSEVERYTRAADQARLARQAMDTLRGTHREQDLSNQPARLDKKERK